FVKIRNVGSTNEVALRQEPGIRYEVNLKHVCPDHTPPVPVTDFALYYTILQAKDGTKFDFLEHPPRVVPPDEPPNSGTEPQVCSSILLGQNFQPPGVSEG